MAKSYEELEFTDNFMFVKIMSTHLDLCAELIGLILQKKISHLEPVTYENTFQPTYESRGIRLDVYVEDDEHSRYDVEMQVEPDINLAKRSRYYHSAMDMEMLLKGKDYSELKQSFVIFICKNEIPGRFDRPVSTFQKLCVEAPEEELDDGTCTVFVNAECKAGDISGEMREFLEFIRTGSAGRLPDSLSGKLHRAVEEAKRSGKWSVEYMRWEDELKHREFLARKEGREQGREEERKNTEAERQRADAQQKRADEEKKRADELAEENARLKAELAAHKEQ